MRVLIKIVLLCSSCACLMRPPSQGTKPYRAHYLSVCCVCMHMYSFAGLIRRTPPPTFSDTAITNRHSDTTFPAKSTQGVDILVYWIGKIVRTCAAGGSRTLDFLRERRTPYPLGQALCLIKINIYHVFYTRPQQK